jgi:hypothetical protein
MTNLMNQSIWHPFEVPPPRIGRVYIVSIVNSMLHDGTYEVTLGCYPTCTCIDFILLLTSSIGKKEKNVPKNTCFSFLSKEWVVIQWLIFSSTNQHWVGWDSPFTTKDKSLSLITQHFMSFFLANHITRNHLYTLLVTHKYSL